MNKDGSWLYLIPAALLVIAAWLMWERRKDRKADEALLKHFDDNFTTRVASKKETVE